MRGVGDDSALVAGFLTGRAESVRQIDVWIHEVLRSPHLRLGSDAEDVAQDVRRKLLIAFRDDRFRGEASLRTYVWKAAQRLAIDHGRTRRRHPAGVSLEAIHEPAATSGGPDAGLDARERRAAFEQVMAGASAECRQLWELIVLEGLAYREAAARLGITEGNVKVRALRCRSRAAECYRRAVTCPEAARPLNRMGS